MEEGQKGGVQSVARALGLLRLVAESEEPLPLAQVVKRSGLNRTTAWRLLCALEDEGFVARDGTDRKYRPGVAAATLWAGASRGYAPLVRAARPVLQRLREQSRETVMLSVPHKAGLLCIDQLDSPDVVRLKSYENTTSPLYCTSNGKVLLGWLSARERAAVLRGPLPKLTANTVTDPAAIEREVAATHKRGYGIVVGEYDEGENGVSAAVQNAGRAGLLVTVSGPGFRFTEDKMHTLAPRLLAACGEIAALLWGGG